MSYFYFWEVKTFIKRHKWLIWVIFLRPVANFRHQSLLDVNRPGTSYVDIRTGPNQVLGWNDVVWKNNAMWDRARIKNMVCSGPSFHTKFEYAVPGLVKEVKTNFADAAQLDTDVSGARLNWQIFPPPFTVNIFAAS